MNFWEAGFFQSNNRTQENSATGVQTGHSKRDAMGRAAFFAIPEPSSEDFRELENLVLGNPFYTEGYSSAMCSLGAEPWILGLREQGKIVSGCTAFLRRGRLNRRLEIVSIPDLSNCDQFWKGLVSLCRKDGISIVDARSFGSTNGMIPKLSGETNRRQRWEFVLDLKDKDLDKGLHRTHRANIRKARDAGVEIRRTSDEGACEEHLKQIFDSRKRRIDRGEMMAAIANSEEYRTYLRCGAGEIFQAVQGGEVVSSDLILKSAQGVYAHSAGTSARGMNCHASHLMIYEMARVFQRESKHTLNLGGVDDLTSGLAQFKSYFGANVVELQSAEFYFGNLVQKKLTEVVDLWHSRPHAS